MGAHRFDEMIRLLTHGVSRRGAMRRFAAAVGLLSFLPMAVDARKGKNDRKRRKRTKRKQPLQFNTFGCLDVGAKCRGKDDLCCSGICDGKKPRKGKRDKSRCVAHNVGSCLAGQDAFPPSPCGTNGLCAATTGKALFCGATFGACADCTKDDDCVGVSGPGAACIIITGQCPSTGGRGCFAAAA